jgi:hypothetical protein
MNRQRPSSEVLRLGSVQRLHHLDAEAGTVTENTANWGMDVLTDRMMLAY